MPISDFLQPTATAGRIQTKTAPNGGISRFLETKSGIKTKNPVAKKISLRSSQGLRTLAEGKNVELSKLPEVGEDPNQIFSGGFIQDTFDAMNLLQYGVTGLLKGRSFSEGVKTRQSFSDKDALGDFGLPGVIGGIAADIAVDPLTYIAPWTLFRRIPFAMKGVKAAKNAAAKTRVGQFLGKSFIYRFGEDPIYKAIDERRIKNIGIANRNIIDMVKPIAKLDASDQVKIADARKAGKLESLPQELLDKAKPAFDELDRLGKEAVDVGLLSKEVFEKNVGKYMARLYRSKEFIPGTTDKLKKVPFAETKPLRIDITRFMKRNDIPSDVREAMGEILEAGYPTAKSMTQLKAAIENARFFGKVNKGFASDVAADGLTKLPDSRRLGDLANKYVPDPIASSINEIIRIKDPTERALGKVVAAFKFQKVILNPATHARNIMSNFILNNFEGLNPARLDIYTEAAANIAKKGKWFKEAQQQGLGLSTFAANELRGFITSPEVKKLGKTRGAIQKSLDNIAELYEKEEQFAKMAQYIFQRKSGKTAEQAWEIAERATFNYAQITPFIRKMRESIFGYPFITFTAKVTPQVLRTVGKKPTKISNLGKIKNAIENMSDVEELKRERATEPHWVRDGLYIKLPIKDKFDRSAYFDLTYIVPFGDVVSGDFFQRGIKRETGLAEGPISAVSRQLPFINLIRELATNQDFFGNKVYRESDSTERQLGDVFRHVFKMMTPPPISDQIPGGYRLSGKRRGGAISRTLELEREGIEGVESGGKQVRDLGQELLRNIGLKISPVDIDVQEKYAEWQEQNALRTILQEAGEIGTFELPFIPKEKK